MSAFRLVLFDDDAREQFLPLAWTKPVADFRIGIFTIREKWEQRLKSESTTWTADYLSEIAPFAPDASKQHLWINGRVVPTGELAFEVLSLQPGEALIKGELLIAVNAGHSIEPIQLHVKDHLGGDISVKDTHTSVIVLQRIHDIFRHNGQAIVEDFELVKTTEGGTLSTTNNIIGMHPVYAGNNIIAEACIFNTTKGPIFIGDGAEIMEGSLLRGPLAICAGATIKMGAKIYGDTTIGPGCKVGGEVSNSVFFANSNKAHDGFIGNSVIGEWCNLGADTNCSNLKNNYGEVSVWNYAIGGNENTGLQFHGVIMGDHAKCGINTMFNTGSVVGVSANIFGGGFPPKFIPDFAWGGVDGILENELSKALETIDRVYARRKKKMEPAEIAMLKAVFKKTEKQRK
ncbi:MAG: glucose-1-phosphate thymidylyltransferase [Bacteroidota bacterium]|nr:glucose-1-phosphate thymidylyltransferase [Bacteroidota bacterium]